MVVWTLGQRHNGHPTILKIVSSARARARVCVCVCLCVPESFVIEAGSGG